MANSGPHSNGSQFFVTVTATPSLNDVHTVFGRVVSGQSVVQAISEVATDDGDKPLIPVVLQNVSIRRVGSDALNFDIHAQNLPVVSHVPLTIARDSGGIVVEAPHPPFAWHRVCQSSNLLSWTSTDLGHELNPSGTLKIARTIEAASQFFTLTRVQYPSSIHTPPRMQRSTLSVAFDDGLGTLTIAFDERGGGTYVHSGSGPGEVTSYVWEQEPYRGFLWPIEYSALVPMTLRLDFTGATSGRISGTAYAVFPFSVTGTFQWAPGG